MIQKWNGLFIGWISIEPEKQNCIDPKKYHAMEDKYIRINEKRIYEKNSGIQE